MNSLHEPFRKATVPSPPFQQQSSMMQRLQDGDGYDNAQLPEAERVAGIPLPVAEVLYADLHVMATVIAGISFTTYAKKIWAARHGHRDEVEWAYEWYGEIVEGARTAMNAAITSRTDYLF